jgi:hypothetical protein
MVGRRARGLSIQPDREQVLACFPNVGVHQCCGLRNISGVNRHCDVWMCTDDLARVFVNAVPKRKDATDPQFN